MSQTDVKRIIIVEGPLLENGTGKGTGTGNMKDITGTEIMTEIGIMIGTMRGEGKETDTEIEIVKEIETGIGIETVIACEMTTTIETETEKGTGMVGKRNAGTETVAGTGAVRGAGAGIDE